MEKMCWFGSEESLMTAGNGDETTTPKPKIAQKTKGFLKRINQAGSTKVQAESEYKKKKPFRKTTMKIWNVVPDNVMLGNAAHKHEDFGSKSCKVTPKLPPAAHGHEENMIEQTLKQGSKISPAMKPQIIIGHLSSPESNFAEKEKERRKALKVRIKALKEQNRNLRFQVEKEAELAAELKEKNINLLNDLRRKLPPGVIARLEAENPDRD